MWFIKWVPSPDFVNPRAARLHCVSIPRSPGRIDENNLPKGVVFLLRFTISRV
jgi:hypothetical protein